MTAGDSDLFFPKMAWAQIRMAFIGPCTATPTALWRKLTPTKIILHFPKRMPNKTNHPPNFDNRPLPAFFSAFQ